MGMFWTGTFSKFDIPRINSAAYYFNNSLSFLLKNVFFIKKTFCCIFEWLSYNFFLANLTVEFLTPLSFSTLLFYFTIIEITKWKKE